MTGIGVIGCGYWGPNIIRNFNETQESRVEVLCDLDSARLQSMARKYYIPATTQNYKELIANPKVNAVAIVTPVSTHYSLAKEALEAGKHVWIEKPMSASVEEAEELIEIAQRKGKIIFVDHTFIYNGSVRKMKEIIDSGVLGQIYYFDSVRVNLGLFQKDINVVWDLAPHDISIMDYLLGKEAVSVSAQGVSHVVDSMADIAYISVKFEGSLIAHFHVNWLAPTKIRLIQIGCSNKMLVYDDMDPAEKIKVYDKGVDIKAADKDGIYNALIQYRLGDMYAPRVDLSEALAVACKHFLSCVKKEQKPITDGAAGLNVVRILEATDHSIRAEGATIRL